MDASKEPHRTAIAQMLGNFSVVGTDATRASFPGVSVTGLPASRQRSAVRYEPDRSTWDFPGLSRQAGVA